MKRALSIRARLSFVFIFLFLLVIVLGFESLNSLSYVNDASAQIRERWLPSEADRAFVRSLMVLVTEPGKVAGWIAQPDRGINKQAPDYEYVRLN